MLSPVTFIYNIEETFYEISNKNISWRLFIKYIGKSNKIYPRCSNLWYRYGERKKKIEELLITVTWIDYYYRDYKVRHILCKRMILLFWYRDQNLKPENRYVGCNHFSIKFFLLRKWFYIYKSKWITFYFNNNVLNV